METAVLVVTDDAVLATGLASVLEATDDLRIATVCCSAQALFEAIERSMPQVVLIDTILGLPLSVLADIRKSFPECHICLWARHVSDAFAYGAITIGIRGILQRTLPLADVLTCLRKVAAGEVWLEEKLMAGFFSKRPASLTRRESQLVTLLGQGLKNKEIAYRLSLSEGTVKVYMSKLFQKLSVNDRLELALYGLRNLSGDQAGMQLPVSQAKCVAAGPETTAFAAVAQKYHQVQQAR
jgi:DNA-binding NarL/FixJ family response regulator